MNKAINAINLTVLLLGFVVIAIVVNFFARLPGYRERIDATKTRAYSLSEQTHALLGNLQGQWKIALILDQRRADRAMRRQIDEVLDRYTDASSSITVTRIDPSDPSTLLEYDALLIELNRLYQPEIDQYNKALDAAADALSGLLLFAQQQGGQLEMLVQLLPPQDQLRESLRDRVNALTIWASQGAQLVATVRDSRQANDARPLPDYDAARSTLAAALTQAAAELDELAQTLSRLAQRPETDGAAKTFVSGAQNACSAMSQQLAQAADPLKHLQPLELSSIGNQLQQGEAAVILSPTRAAVIPASQLFPKSNVRRADDGRTLFDQRFRGEQLISSALRSLTIEHMPLVVFMQAEDQSLFSARDRQADLVGVTSLLKSARHDVREWMLSKSTTRPTGVRGQPVVWVVVPPPPARSMEPSAADMALIEAINNLLADGESVLLSVAPSVVSRYGRTDPLAAIAVPFGIDADTSSIVLERPTGIDSQVVFGHVVHEFSDEHLIGRALNGLQTYFGMPVALSAKSDHKGVVTIASIAPAPTRWLEREWTGDVTRREPNEHNILTDPVAVVMASERMSQRGRPQRMIVCGAGGWMISNVADVVVDISGGAGRVALVNPGNHELMLASVAWLAGMDDLIAASPISQEVSRLREVTPQVRAMWMWVILAGLPGLCVALGITVWMVRRR